jgi:predicted dehydrogenase
MSAPRLGFVGLGWIGAMRLEAVAASGRAEVVALCDPVRQRLDAAGQAHPDAVRFEAFDDLLDRAAELALDGVVVATPNALHALQSIACLDRGLAVFCQKPLAPTAAEARSIVDAARRADRLLAVDYSYRYTDGARALHRLVHDGELGEVFSVDSVFHNAYGPDKAWAYDPALAGGGALVDLGVHQIDLALWLLGYPAIRAVSGRAYRDGAILDSPGIDDFAIARLELEGGATVQIAVSWNAHAGRDCIIRTTLFGTRGGAELRNVDGSFYTFDAYRHRGRTTASLGRETHDWLGRCILEWVERLGESPAFDDAVERSVRVAEVVDAVYGRAPVPAI